MGVPKSGAQRILNAPRHGPVKKQHQPRKLGWSAKNTWSSQQNRSDSKADCRQETDQGQKFASFHHGQTASTQSPGRRVRRRTDPAVR